MSTEVDQLNMSQLSISSQDSQSSQEDWDRSLIMNDSTPPTPAEDSQSESQTLATTTPRNSVIFPATGGDHATPKGGQRQKRSISELLKLYAEKGTDCTFSTEEAGRVAEVLGQWINASSSPYEDEDDDFFKRSQDDLSIPPRRSPLPDSRSRGQSESAGARPSSSAGR